MVLIKSGSISELSIDLTLKRVLRQQTNRIGIKFGIFQWTDFDDTEPFLRRRERKKEGRKEGEGRRRRIKERMKGRMDNHNDMNLKNI